MDDLDRRIVAGLQEGLALVPRPYAAAAAALGTDEATLLARLAALLADGTLSRLGPLYDARRLGGAFTLCAMSVPDADFERVSRLVNDHAEVAHNYQRAHRYNMWFVLATASPGEAARAAGRIAAETGYPVLELPKLAEYFVGLRLAA